MAKFKNMIWGILFIAVGVIVGLNAFGITDINLFFDGWWTLLIIVPSAISLFSSRDKTTGLIGIAVGVLLLLGCQDILTFDLLRKLLLPSVLVVIGLSFIFKGFSGGDIGRRIKMLSQSIDPSKNYFSAFSGQKVNFHGENFHGAELTAVFGGIDCDLSTAIITEDVVINACAIFGGIDIIIPEDVNVKIKSNSIFGGVSNKRKFIPAENAPTVYINATCIFGGADIK